MNTTDEIIVFDFDKTLTYRDTVLDFLKFCAQEVGVRFVYTKVFIWYCLAVLAKLKIISNTKIKQAGIQLFLKGISKEQIENSAIKFINTLKLNQLYYCGFQSFEDPLIVSASFEEYLNYMFPKHKVIGSKMAYDEGQRVSGLLYNCYGQEKVNALNEQGISHIYRFYTDSYSDTPLMDISEEVFLVHGDQIKKIK